jgi:tetratricopeptide (TPR) repeat protein
MGMVPLDAAPGALGLQCSHDAENRQIPVPGTAASRDTGRAATAERAGAAEPLPARRSTTMPTWAWALGLTVALAVTSAGCTQDGDVQALIAKLELPRIATFSIWVGLNAEEMLSDDPGPSEAAEEVETLRPRADAGQATAAEWLRLAKLYSTTGTPEERKAAEAKAVALHQAAAHAKPDDVSVLLGLGLALKQAGEVARAEQVLNRALEVGPDYLPAYNALVDLLIFDTTPWSRRMRGFGDPFRQVEEGLLKQAMTRESPAELARHLQELREKAPELKGALEKVEAEAKTPEAIERCRRALEQATALVVAARPLYHQRLAAEPSAALFAQYVALEARGALAQEEATDPALWADVGGMAMTRREGLALALLRTQVYEVGQKVCEALPEEAQVRGFVGSLQVTRVLADMMERMEKHEALPVPDPVALEQAKGNLQVGLSLPLQERPGMVGGLAFLHMLAGERDEAARVVEEAVRRGEWDFGAVSMALMAQMGMSFADMTRGVKPPTGEHPEVEEMLGRWLEKLQPEEAAPWATLAKLRGELGRWEGAVEPLERACRLGPNEMGYAVGLGIVHLKLGHVEQAVTLLGEAVRKGTEDPGLQRQAHHAYGVALLAAGRKDEGERELGWDL